ncbi:calcium-dependent protein kinase 27-like [Humulus lupulus]|uniref:calcium-dependent protein kinase 27-like n=1 Tax=Humulus lupulus TaxID=3486 RepID=UPI002B40BCC3|nr:calcium-dependent protein kinase 27-like [Humulus lupulus]
MASANVFDLYSTQEEEEVPLVRKKRLTRKHDGDPSQMPSAKKNRATVPSKDGPSGQTSAQPPAPLEKEIPPPPAPATTTSSPPAPTEQAQQAKGAPPGAKLSSHSLRSAKDRLAHILKHDRCKEAMAEAETMGAMLTMTVARARAGASVEQSCARELKLMEELRAAEARHAGELEVVTQQKDSLAADLVEKQASLESARKQREEYQEAS